MGPSLPGSLGAVMRRSGDTGLERRRDYGGGVAMTWAVAAAMVARRFARRWEWGARTSCFADDLPCHTSSQSRRTPICLISGPLVVLAGDQLRERW